MRWVYKMPEAGIASFQLALPIFAVIVTGNRRSEEGMFIKAEWHSRGYLPHWEAGDTPQAIGFRLADSLPSDVLQQILAELDEEPDGLAKAERRKRMETMLDHGHGEAFLTQPAIGELLQNALLFFDNDRYRLHAWCIMPNHVHVLITPLYDHAHAAIVHSWKSFTAQQINRILGRTGPLWFREYFDRKIRSERHFEAARYYIEQNPVKAGLCDVAEKWPFSSAWKAPLTGLVL